MQAFYRKALIAFVLLLLADALLAFVLVRRSVLALPLLPAQRAGGEHAVRWHYGYTSDPWPGEAQVVRVDTAAADRLKFALRLPAGGPDPNVSADLLARDGNGRPTRVDLSKYDTIAFTATCTPANSLVFVASVYDEHASQPGNFLTYPPASTYFSCSEQGTPVRLDLKRLTVPTWWFETLHRDLAHQDFPLVRVERLVFGATPQSPRGVPANVELSGIVLRGRDPAPLAWLAGLLVGGWLAFGAWFFRTHARTLIASVTAQLKQDRPLVAYRQLTLEPHRDRERAAVLRYIATHYTDPELDLERVAGATGTNRTKVNGVLKSELGMTFTGYLNKLRLAEAARRLAAGDGTTVAAIAEGVGYANVPYFNKLFKEEYGCTPKGFREVASKAEGSTA
jgi:AraC-like DNA-binding protein